METYKQEICTECLMMFETGESQHSDAELIARQKTLIKWAEDEYIPAGMETNCEPFFSWKKCDLCGQIAGDRYEYNFIQK